MTTQRTLDYNEETPQRFAALLEHTTLISITNPLGHADQHGSTASRPPRSANLTHDETGQYHGTKCLS